MESNVAISIRRNLQQKLLNYFKITNCDRKNLSDNEGFIATRIEDPKLSRLQLDERQLFLKIQEKLLFDPIEISLEKKKKNSNDRGEHNDSEFDHEDDDHSEKQQSQNSEARKFSKTIDIDRNDDLKKNKESRSKIVCRQRRPNLRNEYYYVSRNIHIFHCIRYSFSSIQSQKFLQTFDGQEQVRNTFESSRNMVTVIVPEEEIAKLSKILLISTQSIKQAKRHSHKYRNTRWHRQLNLGVNFKSFFFRTNFKFLKNGNDKLFIKTLPARSLSIDELIQHDHSYAFSQPAAFNRIESKNDSPNGASNAIVRPKSIHRFNLYRIFNVKKSKLKRTVVKKHLEISIVQDWTPSCDDPLVVIEPPKSYLDPMFDSTAKIKFQSFKSYENFIEWEREQRRKRKTELVNEKKSSIFQISDQEIEFEQILQSMNLKMDLNVINDPEKLKLIWLYLLNKTDPRDRKMLKLVHEQIQIFRNQNRFKLFRKRSNPNIESLIETLPHNGLVIKPVTLDDLQNES
ncbi:hypothetical protein NH340_JMT05519 [Sarcoptes scabiei]|nr:hypothetical protein NH340_JMT05519 [Sarcoptes scabiei]